MIFMGLANMVDRRCIPTAKFHDFCSPPSIEIQSYWDSLPATPCLPPEQGLPAIKFWREPPVTTIGPDRRARLASSDNTVSGGTDSWFEAWFVPTVLGGIGVGFIFIGGGASLLVRKI